jgi:hypothetical protein
MIARPTAGANLVIDRPTVVTDIAAERTIHPTGSVTIIRALMAVASAALAALGWKLDLLFLPWPLAIFATVGAAGVIRAVIGRVHLDNNGITVRRFLRSKRLAWSDLLGFSVNENVSSRSLSVHHGTETLQLPVPRTSRLVPDPRFDGDAAFLQETSARRNGKIAAALPTRRSRRLLLIGGLVITLVTFALPDRPWGWIGGPTASTIPQACAVLTPAFVIQFQASDGAPFAISPATASLETYADESSCSWNLPNDGTLLVLFERYQRHGLHSGKNEAEHNANVGNREMHMNLDMTQAPSATAHKYGIRGTLLTGVNVQTHARVYVVLTTRSNVMVEVGMTGDLNLDQIAAATKTALDAVTIT